MTPLLCDAIPCVSKAISLPPLLLPSTLHSADALLAYNASDKVEAAAINIFLMSMFFGFCLIVFELSLLFRKTYCLHNFIAAGLISETSPSPISEGACSFSPYIPASDIPIEIPLTLYVLPWYLKIVPSPMGHPNSIVLPLTVIVLADGADGLSRWHEAKPANKKIENKVAVCLIICRFLID